MVRFDGQAVNKRNLSRMMQKWKSNQIIGCKYTVLGTCTGREVGRYGMKKGWWWGGGGGGGLPVYIRKQKKLVNCKRFSNTVSTRDSRAKQDGSGTQ